MRVQLISIFIACSIASYAQLSDLQLIEKAIQKPDPEDHREVHCKVNQFFDTCIYDQKCGVFASRSFRQFGPLKGFFLSIDRRLRCSSLVKSQALPVIFDSNGFIINHAEDYSVRLN